MSTLKVTNIESPSGGGVNAKITDINGGQLGNRNLIINGAMNIAQRGTSSTTNGYGSVDRFFIQWDGGTTTHTQTAITSGSPYDQGFRNVLRLTNTATATGAGNYRNPFQYIEAQNLAQSGWNYTSSSSYVTLSFWVRSSVAQEFYGYLRTFDGTEQAYSFSIGTLSANTWTKVTKTIPGNSNITINDDTGTGLQVNISPFWGTDFTDSGNTPESWAAFNDGSRTPDYTNTWANTTDATFDITGLQLEVGDVATAFEHRSYGDELAKCQRYYYKAIADTGDTFCNGYNQNTRNTRNILHFPVTMRSAPTALEQTGTAANYRILHGTTENACSGVPIFLSATTNTGEIQADTGSGLTAGQGNALESNSNDTYLAFSAEL